MVEIFSSLLFILSPQHNHKTTYRVCNFLPPCTYTNGRLLQSLLLLVANKYHKTGELNKATTTYQSTIHMKHIFPRCISIYFVSMTKRHGSDSFCDADKTSWTSLKCPGRLTRRLLRHFISTKHATSVFAPSPQPSRAKRYHISTDTRVSEFYNLSSS